MMSRKECTLSDRTYFLYRDETATYLLIQPIDEHDLEVLDQEVEAIKELSDEPFSLVAFMIKDWWSRKNAGVRHKSSAARGSRYYSSHHTWRLFSGRFVRLMGRVSDKQV